MSFILILLSFDRGVDSYSSLIAIVCRLLDLEIELTKEIFSKEDI
jgi:hypothetical protein